MAKRKFKTVNKLWAIEENLANRINNLADKYAGGVQSKMVDRLLRLGIEALPDHLATEATKASIARADQRGDPIN